MYIVRVGSIRYTVQLSKFVFTSFFNHDDTPVRCGNWAVEVCKKLKISTDIYLPVSSIIHGSFRRETTKTKNEAQSSSLQFYPNILKVKTCWSNIFTVVISFSPYLIVLRCPALFLQVNFAVILFLMQKRVPLSLLARFTLWNLICVKSSSNLLCVGWKSSRIRRIFITAIT